VAVRGGGNTIFFTSAGADFESVGFELPDWPSRLPGPEFGLEMGRWPKITIIEAYALTDTGMHLVEHLVEGQPLEPEPADDQASE
jgi:hypothetical protein